MDTCPFTLYIITHSSCTYDLFTHTYEFFKIDRAEFTHSRLPVLLYLRAALGETEITDTRGEGGKKEKRKTRKKNSRRGTYAFVTTVCHRRTVSVPLFAKTDSATLSDKAASSDRGPFSYGRCGTRFSRWWEIKSRNGGVFFVVMRQTSKRCIYYCYSVRVRNVAGGREKKEKGKLLKLA